MLQQINQYIRGWFAAFIIGLVAITFIFWGISNYVQTHVDTTLVEVNGESITTQAFRYTYEQLRQRMMAQFGADFQITPQIDKELKQKAIENLTTDKVLEQAAKHFGYYVSMQQVEQIL